MEPQATERPMPNVIGPGAIEQVGPEYKPALEGSTRDEIITILNPLPQDFVAKVGVTRTANMPVSIGRPANMPSPMTESQLAAGGIQIRNPDLGGGRVHIANEIRIPAGSTIKQPGDVAQVIVKQLITAIAQVRKQNLKIADPDTRRQIEQEVVIGRRPMAELFGTEGPITVDQQLQEAVRNANAESEEPAFPEVTQPEPKRGNGKAKADNASA